VITNLSIKNYALIDDILVPFSAGLNIITGETGAGKSIVLGALSLLLGKRADLSNIKDTSKKCVIEGEFNLAATQFKTIFETHNLDFEEHTIIRRELLPSGKTRAFVNDTPVTITQLQTIAPLLVDIHSQHETLNLFSETFQLEIIDVLANNFKLLENYSSHFEEYNEISETISDLIYKKESADKELDYNTFLFNELVEVKLESLNQKKLEETYETLNNTEEIQESLAKVSHFFSDEQTGTLETLKETRNVLSKIISYSLVYKEFWDRINSVIIELEDVSEELNQKLLNLESDPSLLIILNEKLQSLYKLQQKHSVNSVSELLMIQGSLASKIEITTNLEDRISKLEQQQLKLEKELKSISENIHNKRIKVIPTLIKKLKGFLIELGLPNAAFKFNISASKYFRKNGTDNLQLLFTANKGMDFGLIKKVASGGEISRIMLSVKAVLAQYKKLPTMIFDEIDTGVSGDVAYKMASILEEMGSAMQMICITHLPQIAAIGNHHIKIYKEDINHLTVTKLIALNKEKRIAELAEMIGGKSHTITALNQAKELLN